jgi:hypothetical protein
MALDLDVEDPAGTIKRNVAITSGHLRLMPAEGIDVDTSQGPGKEFLLTDVNLSFEDFTVTVDIAGVPLKDVTHTHIGVTLRDAVWITLLPTARPGNYFFRLPVEHTTLYSAAFINGVLESGIDRPNRPVQGFIDLNDGSFRAQVFLDKKFDVPTPEGGIFNPFGENITVTGTIAINLRGHLSMPDADGDGISDFRDNCRLVANPDQTPVASPTISVPADITVASCLPPRIGHAIGLDVCNGRAVTVTNDAPAVFAPGATTVTWTATDPDGNTASEAQRVTVVDTTPPAFTFVPPPVVAIACGPVDLGGVAQATDDCRAPAVTHDAPASFPPGPTTLTWTARDAFGNTTTATQIVTVNDTTPPVFTHVPPPVTITTCTGADIGRAQARDACGVTVTNDAPAKFPLGGTVVTWTARDGAGNVGQVTQRVTARLGDDASCCPTGTNIIEGTNGRDTLLGTPGDDCILARGGDDVIDARGGDDYVSAGAGRDTVAAGFGRDLVNGGPGDDVIDAGPGDDTIDGGPGVDTCAAGTGRDVIERCEIPNS